MVEERTKVGTKALSNWMRKCRTVGELRGETFVSYWMWLTAKSSTNILRSGKAAPQSVPYV